MLCVHWTWPRGATRYCRPSTVSRLTGVVRHSPLLRPRTARTREPQTLRPRRVIQADGPVEDVHGEPPGFCTCVDVDMVTSSGAESGLCEHCSRLRAVCTRSVIQSKSSALVSVQRSRSSAPLSFVCTALKTWHTGPHEYRTRGTRPSQDRGHRGHQGRGAQTARRGRRRQALPAGRGPRARHGLLRAVPLLPQPRRPADRAHHRRLRLARRAPPSRRTPRSPTPDRSRALDRGVRGGARAGRWSTRTSTRSSTDRPCPGTPRPTRPSRPRPASGCS